MRIIKYGFFVSILTYALGILVNLAGFKEIGFKILMVSGFSAGGFVFFFFVLASILGSRSRDDY